MPQRPAIDSDAYAGWTDTQLVAQVTGNAGAAGAGAHAEITRRLMLALRASAKRADRFAWIVIGLTVAIAVLTAVLVALTVALLIDA